MDSQNKYAYSNEVDMEPSYETEDSTPENEVEVKTTATKLRRKSKKSTRNDSIISADLEQEDPRSLWEKLKPLAIFLVPILLLPLPLVKQDNVALFAYCLLIIAIFWIFEILNIYVTSFLPMILLPLTGLVSPGVLAKEYMPNVSMLFIGTLILACGIEKTGVHRRMALLTLKVFGNNTRQLMFGLMIITWFLSMWISNTAATALMLPVIEAIFTVFSEGLDTESASASQDRKRKAAILPDAVTKGLTLAIACGANIGGMGTLTGTPPNLVCSSLMEETFPCYEPDLSFARWLIYAWPISIIYFILAYIYMNIYWYGLPFCGEDRYKEFSGEKIQSVIRQQYDQLPKMQFCEYYTVGTLTTMVILWFFKSPGFMNGWVDLYTTSAVPGDSTVALLFAGFLFVVPKELPKGHGFCGGLKRLRFDKPIITWPEFQAYCPWGTIILIGSGVALSKASSESGFSQYIADLLTIVGVTVD